MRKPSFAAWMILAAATAFAGSRAETTTYVDGNLTGISPNTGGTLVFSDDKTMAFRTGLETVTIAYTSVTKSELGATRETSHNAAFYKVWARRKKTETQFLTVEFKSEEGEAKTMTLELSQASAPEVLAAIKERTGPEHADRAEIAATPPTASSPAPAAAAPASPKITPAAHAAAPTAATGKPINNPQDAGARATPATKAGSDWWGDDIWKTNRNASSWTKTTAVGAPQE